MALLGRNFELFEAIAHVTQRPGPTAYNSAVDLAGGTFSASLLHENEGDFVRKIAALLLRPPMLL